MPRTRTVAAIAAAAIVALLGLRALVTTAPFDRLAVAVPDARDPKDPPGAVVRTGSLAIARGGPVIVGFVASGRARLVVGDHELVGQGLVKDRLVLPAGPIAIRIAGDARLVWSPVGRRGDPEYVPASALSPEPPDRAQFGAWAGAAPLDGVFAALIAAIVVAFACYLARARFAAVPRTLWLAAGVVFAAACIARLVDLSGFGQTWDEDVYWASGRNYITNLLSLDFSADAWRWNFEHPPITKYLAGIGAQFADGYGPARALSAVASALGCALLVPIGARLYRLRVGVLAGAIAALLPPLVAHGQIVGHESPTILWWSLGLVLALGATDDPARVRVRLVQCGIAIGLAAGTRYVGGLLGPLLFAIVIVRAPDRRAVARTAAWIMPLAALVTFYVVWPRLWLHPIGALSESLAKLQKLHSVEPFLGAMTDKPGAAYFPIYLAATLPIGVAAGVVAWLVRAARARDAAAAITVLWLVIPLGVALSPVRQDGVRYVLPCVAALAVAAAAGFDYLASLVERRFAHAYAAAGAALVIYLGITLVRVHPYYLDYFAEQTGGAGTVAAHRWFETAWWGEGVAAAVDYVGEHAAPGARVDRDCIEPAHLAWFRSDLWAAMTHNAADAESIVAYAPASHGCAIPPDAQREFAVEADGAVLAEVWHRRIPAPAPPAPLQ